MKREKGTADFRCPFCIYASKTISRVLYLTVIYLDVPLPVRSSHPGSGRASLGARSPCSHTGVAPDRVYSDGYFDAPSGELLPRLSTLTDKTHSTTSLATVCSDILSAVFLCCTFPEVAFGGRYPLSLPCGARTFLINGLSACSRDCLSYSRVLFYLKAGKMSTMGKIWRRFFEKFPLCVALPVVLPYNELYLQKFPLGEKWTGKGGRPATACSQALLLSGG